MIYFECRQCSFVNGYEDNTPMVCPECDSKWYVLRFGHEKEKQTVNIDGTSRGCERFSSTMGCNPNEVEKFRKLYPESTYTPDGRLVIQSRQHKKQEMRRRGYQELD